MVLLFRAKAERRCSHSFEDAFFYSQADVPGQSCPGTAVQMNLTIAQSHFSCIMKKNGAHNQYFFGMTYAGNGGDNGN